MKGLYTGIAVLVIIVVIAGAVVLYQSRGSGSVSTPQENSVSIVDFAFQPASITVSVGTTITWTNTGSVVHNVISTSGPAAFGSGNISPGGTFQVTFENAGTYNYKCTIHGFIGTVIVQ